MFIRLNLQTRSKVDDEITDQVKAAIAGAGIEDGICFIYCPHMTAGIVLTEDAKDPVESDLALVLDRIVPESLLSPFWKGIAPHTSRRSACRQRSLHLRTRGQLALGQWQGIFLAEFDGPRHRDVGQSRG